jgi:hypothetical protein
MTALLALIFFPEERWIIRQWQFQLGTLLGLFGAVGVFWFQPDWVAGHISLGGIAIAFTAAVSLALALSGSFASMAAVSAVSRLVVYVGTCASVLALRRGGRAPFTIALGPVIPCLAILISLAILYGATPAQRVAGGIGLGLGAILFGLARLGSRS